jgi:hypothetical protein
MRDHAHTLSDFRVPTLSIECEPCGRRGRYNAAGSWKSTATPSCPSCGIFSRIARRRSLRASMTDARSGTAETAGFRDREGEALTGLDAFDRLFAGIGLSL